MIRLRQVGATQLRYQADAGDAERVNYVSFTTQSPIEPFPDDG